MSVVDKGIEKLANLSCPIVGQGAPDINGRTWKVGESKGFPSPQRRGAAGAGQELGFGLAAIFHRLRTNAACHGFNGFI